MVKPEIINPPVDRSRPPDEVADVFLHVDQETDAGIVVSGAKVVATGSALTQLGPKWSDFLATKGQELKAYLDDLQLAYQMLRDPHFQVSKQTKTVLIIAFLYIIAPIDLIPDAIPFLGMLDDVLVAGYALRQASAELERYRQTLQSRSGA